MSRRIEQRSGVSIAFGLERLGLIAVQKPIVSCIVLVGLVIAALFGIDRIKIDNSLSQLFRSNSKEYRQYEAETKRFPATEFDVLVVVEGKTLLKRENLEKVRDLVTDLQLVEGTRGLISLFSARQAPAPGKLPAALFPSELPEGADYDKFIETVKANEIIRGKLLSEDGTLALVVLSLEPEVVASNKLCKTIGEIRKLMAEDLAGSGLNAELSGVPVMQLEIRNAVKRDGLTYNVLGILAGCIIAIIFFRKISFMVIAAFPPIIAIVLALGGLGWANFNLNMFLNVMTPLIMVISFSDSMQLTFAARDRLIAGPGQIHRVQECRTGGRAGLCADPWHRRHIVHRPAILRFRPDPQIRRGGTWPPPSSRCSRCCRWCRCSACCWCATKRSSRSNSRAPTPASRCCAISATGSRCAWSASPGLFSLIAVLVVGGLAVVYANLEPRYRLADQVPDKQQAVAASDASTPS